MPKIRIQGQVSYWNGKPVSGATIKIVDLDEDERHDTILAATTNNRGQFSGLSKEWQDVRQMPFITLPAWTDTMVLQFEVTRGSQKHSGPFLYINDTTSVPIIVPWLESPVLATVNGIDCDKADEILSEAIRAIQSGQRIKIQILDPASVEALQVLTESPEAILAWIEEKVPMLGQQLRQIPGLSSRNTSSAFQTFAVEPVSASLTILAIAILVLVSGVSIVLAGIAVTLILAVSLGYCKIEVDQGTKVGSDGATETTIDFDIAKC
jgi:hypothetical protein